jgi:hypothetical protein
MDVPFLLLIAALSIATFALIFGLERLRKSR